MCFQSAVTLIVLTAALALPACRGGEPSPPPASPVGSEGPSTPPPAHGSLRPPQAPTRLVGGGAQRALAVDGTHAWFVDAEHRVSRVPLAGGPVEVLTTLAEGADEMAIAGEDAFVLVSVENDQVGLHRVSARTKTSQRLSTMAVAMALTPDEIAYIDFVDLVRSRHDGQARRQAERGEHRPVALAASGDEVFVLTREGVVLRWPAGTDALAPVGSTPCRDAGRMVASGPTLVVACREIDGLLVLDPRQAPDAKPAHVLEHEPSIVDLAPAPDGSVYFLTPIRGRIGLVPSAPDQPIRYVHGAAGRWRALAAGQDHLVLAGRNGLATLARDTSFTPVALGQPCDSDESCVAASGCLPDPLAPDSPGRCTDLREALVAELRLAVDQAERAADAEELATLLAADAEARKERRARIAALADDTFPPLIPWAQSAAKAELERLAALTTSKPTVLNGANRVAIEHAFYGAIELPAQRDALDELLELAESLLDGLEETSRRDGDLEARARELGAAHEDAITALTPRIVALEREAHASPELGLALGSRHESKLGEVRRRWKALAVKHPEVYTSELIRPLDLLHTHLAQHAPALFVRPWSQSLWRSTAHTPEPEDRTRDGLVAAFDAAHKDGATWRREFVLLADGLLAFELFPGDPPLAGPRVVAEQTLTAPWVARLELTRPGSPPTVHWIGRDLQPAADPGRDAAPDGALSAVVLELARPLPPIYRDGWLTERHPSGFIVEVPEPSEVAKSPNGSPYNVASAGTCKVSYLAVLGAIDDLSRLLTLLGSAEHWKAQGATHLATRPGPLPWLLDVDLLVAGEAVSSRFALRPEGFALLQAFGGPSCRSVRERFFASLRFPAPLGP